MKLRDTALKALNEGLPIFALCGDASVELKPGSRLEKALRTALIVELQIEQDLENLVTSPTHHSPIGPAS